MQQKQKYLTHSSAKNITVDLEVERGIYFTNKNHMSNWYFWFNKGAVDILKNMLSSFFQVPFFLAIIYFFGLVGAGEAVREIEYHCMFDGCRQLLAHFTPCTGAGSATQLIQEFFNLQIGSITSCGWQGSCSILCSW